MESTYRISHENIIENILNAINMKCTCWASNYTQNIEVISILSMKSNHNISIHTIYSTACAIINIKLFVATQ